jgi:hypothetical protein
MRTFILVITAAAMLGQPTAASAQRIDLSGHVARIAGFGEGRMPVLAGPGVTFHFSDRHALQLTADIDYESRQFQRSVMTVYTVQYRHTFATPNRDVAVFVTIGGAGEFDWTHYLSETYQRNATTYTTPARTYVDSVPPIIPVFGGGAEYRVSRRVSLRGDVTLVMPVFTPAAARGSVGGVLRLGSVPPAK